MSSCRQTKLVCISVFCALVLLTGCGIETASVPLGTWKAIASERYMSIEEMPASTSTKNATAKSYTVKLFTYKHRDGDDPATSVQTSEPLLLERSVPAKMVEGRLTMEVGANKIPMLYHPDGDRVLVNGISEFRRVEFLGVKSSEAVGPQASS